MTPLNCPTRYSPAETDAAKLLDLLGEAKFVALQRAFGGRRIWIPKAGTRVSCLTCGERDNCIRVWRKQKRPVSDIAKHLGVSPKTVYRVLERPE